MVGVDKLIMDFIFLYLRFIHVSRATNETMGSIGLVYLCTAGELLVVQNVDVLLLLSCLLLRGRREVVVRGASVGFLIRLVTCSPRTEGLPTR